MRHAWYRLKGWRFGVLDEARARIGDLRHRRETRRVKRWFDRAQQMYEEHGGRYSYRHCLLATKGKR